VEKKRKGERIANNLQVSQHPVSDPFDPDSFDFKTAPRVARNMNNLYINRSAQKCNA